MKKTPGQLVMVCGVEALCVKGRSQVVVPGAKKPRDTIAQTRFESVIISNNKESLGEDASKHGRIDVIDADEEITLVSVHDVNVSTGEEVFTTIVDDITLAQVLEEMKSTKPKKKGIVIQELGESTTTISSQLSSQQSQDKGKGILIEHVGNYRFDETKEQKNETKGSKWSLKNSTRCRRNMKILEDLLKKIKITEDIY
ncbi:hypothetical protein Tco_1281083 [Tanacetum coccineum]